jgi:hypothetical protein
VLALDTGLGKTCTVRAILIRVKARAIVVVPGSLVRQVAAGLVCYPWQTSKSKKNSRVAIAETDKQLTTHLITSRHQFLVVNRELLRKNPLEVILHTYKYDIIVLDEAHRSYPEVNRTDFMPILFVTAFPEDPGFSNNLRRFTGSMKKIALLDACFCVKKTQLVVDHLLKCGQEILKTGLEGQLSIR